MQHALASNAGSLPPGRSKGTLMASLLVQVFDAWTGIVGHLQASKVTKVARRSARGKVNMITIS